MLGFTERRDSVSGVNVRIDNSTIIPPCYIGEDVYLINTVGPNVSLGKGCHVTGSVIKTV
jgi:glucose-1-phosphate thymidylyltransferase